MKDVIVEHLSSNSLIRSSQHGFTAGRSCLTNLLEYMEELSRLVDEGLPVNMLYLDFSKAFNLVPHRRLLVKLRGLGIQGKVASWVEEWLGDRKQRVVLNGQASDWGDVVSSVVQGSCLGHASLSFSLMILILQWIHWGSSSSLQMTVKQEGWWMLQKKGWHFKTCLIDWRHGVRSGNSYLTGTNARSYTLARRTPDMRTPWEGTSLSPAGRRRICEF